MSKKSGLVMGGVVFATLLLVLVVVPLVAVGSRSADVPAPTVAGQKVPAAVREIDFDKRYDAHCQFGSEPKVFQGCKVVGFTGPPQTEKASSSMSLSSSSGHEYFERWLILELGDGRLAYIPPRALDYLEEAKGR